MAASIPASHENLLSGPVVVTLVTMMPDGQPQATPVWCLWDGQDILINSAPGRRKDKNIRANPKVTVLAVNPDDPYSYLEVRGEVTEIIEDDEPMIDRLAKLYTGHDKYYGGFASESDRLPRVTYRITPRHVVAN